MTLRALRYPGGKVSIAQWVISHFPAHKGYVEPFGGGAGVLLNKAPSPLEVYNDLSGDVVNFFRVLRDKDKGAELVRRLRLTPFSRDEYYGLYRLPDDADDIERARALYCRCYMGIGVRGAVQGASPTGFSGGNGKKTRKFYAKYFANCVDRLALVSERLRAVVIENKDAMFMFDRYDGLETLWYLDPPYNCKFNLKYTAGVDQEQLLKAVKELKGFCVVSGYMNDLYADELNGWHVETLRSHNFDNRPVVECLWLSPRTWEALQKRRRPMPLLELCQ